ncbi:MAG: ATP-binding protein [Bacteroidetes bacterium]|nr:ATP-binding protein [Bacteroidota bacterium]
MNELHKHIVVKSRSNALKEAEGKLKAIFDRLGISESEEHNLLVATSEAVNNAISHGNKNDPEKNVTLDVDYEGCEIVITVEDEGGGFNPEDLPDPLAPENLLKPSGRGIHIMKSLMDRVDFTFTRRGTKTTMRLKIKEAD